MKSREEIEKKILGLVEMKRVANERQTCLMHTKITGTKAGLEWVIRELENVEDVILDQDKA